MIIDFKCPCGATPQFEYLESLDKYRVKCPKCGMESLFFKKWEMAVEDWKNRHLPKKKGTRK